MRARHVILIIGGVFIQHLCFAQSEDKIIKPSISTAETKGTPTYILKVDTLSVELSKSQTEINWSELIDQHWIESVSVVKDEETMMKYSGGVVIITLSSFDILSKEVKALFEETK